ncbi:hypothetical protein [Streptococcus oralis]|nr:hypothetical protein [Streptococcus oralis]
MKKDKKRFGFTNSERSEPKAILFAVAVFSQTLRPEAQSLVKEIDEVKL